MEALGLHKIYVPSRLAVKKAPKNEGEEHIEVLAFVETGATSAASTLLCFLCGNTGHKAKQCTVVSAEKKHEFLAKCGKDSQSKNKTGVANVEVDEKFNEASTDGDNDFEIPKGAPSY